MDLGIKGKKAIVCAASKGLGRACAMSLAREGVDVVITARTAADAGEDRRGNPQARPARKVTAVAGDITTEAGPRRRAGRLPGARHPGEQRRRPAARRFPRTGAATTGSRRSTPTC